MLRRGQICYIVKMILLLEEKNLLYSRRYMAGIYGRYDVKPKTIIQSIFSTPGHR